MFDEQVKKWFLEQVMEQTKEQALEPGSDTNLLGIIKCKEKKLVLWNFLLSLRNRILQFIGLHRNRFTELVHRTVNYLGI